MSGDRVEDRPPLTDEAADEVIFAWVRDQLWAWETSGESSYELARRLVSRLRDGVDLFVDDLGQSLSERKDVTK